MDTIADPDIVFDNDGVSNYWHDYQNIATKKLIHGETGRKLWAKRIEEIKQAGKGKDYDCIIGVSGGVDSTYVAYLVKQAQLRPLIVHFDNGWNSEIAVKNIESIISYLDSDLFTLVVDWEEFKDLQRAYIKAGVVDIEALTDHAIYGTLYRLASKHKVKYVIGGFNVETEYLMPKSWNFNKIDHRNILDIHSKYGSIPLKTFPIFNSIRKKYYNNFLSLNTVNPLNLAPYKKDVIKDIIIKEIGWQDYGGKHHESIFTKFYQNYILPTKFKIDKRKPHLSNLICSNQLTREEALEELKKPLYDPQQLEEDMEFVTKKLGFSRKEFDAIMMEPPRSHFDFKIEGPLDSHYPILKPIKKIYRTFVK